MIKSLKFHIKNLNSHQFEMLNNMCVSSRKLYNCAVYVCRAYFETNKKYIGYLKLYHEMKDNMHYKALPAKIAQQILKLLDKNYISFFKLLKLKLAGQYDKDVSPPKFKKKNSKFILILPNDQIKFRDSYLKITKDIKMPFSYPGLNPNDIKQAIIIPSNYDQKYFTLCLTYQAESSSSEKDSARMLSIDLGINNLASCFSNVGPSFIMNGKPLKSYNQLYNKRKSAFQSELQICNKLDYSKKLDHLSENRHNWINNYFNQTISYIMKFCKQYDIGKIILGYNQEWKQDINIGKKNNQAFCDIPFFKFKRKLISKCLENNIVLVIQEESYTSKCSFLDNERVEKHDQYLGKRIRRGLFKTSKGTLCNADVNGAANTMEKHVVSELGSVDKNKEIEGYIVSPVVLKTPFNRMSLTCEA